MTGRGALLFLGVLALFLAIFVPLVLRVRGGRDRALDAERLRRTFVALALYQNENDEFPAPNLGLVRRDIDPIDLTSVDDSLAKPAKEPATDLGGRFPGYPLDPFVPNLRLVSPTRVSWSYRYHWSKAGDPRATSLDPRRGLLADPWPGTLLRVDMDGAIIDRPRGEPTFEGLFGQ